MSSATLLKRVRKLEQRLEPTQEARQYSICLEEGEEVSAELRSQLNTYDQLIVRYYPKNWLSEDKESTSGQVMSCWVRGPKGVKIPTVVRQYGDVDISRV